MPPGVPGVPMPPGVPGVPAFPAFGFGMPVGKGKLTIFIKFLFYYSSCKK
jgi:hypothetical protein